MANDEPIDLQRERRIRRKIRGLGEAIENAGERDEFDRNPTDYLESKTMNDEEFEKLKEKVASLSDQDKMRLLSRLIDKPVMKTSDVASLVGMTEESVRRWIRAGDLPAIKTGDGYRISRADLSRFWKERGGGQLFID